ncbi:LysM peptidoglycan-binding domain-containing protein [Brevibacillus nitrificans]|jgi:nucleoid-associated protein YgaU|uniref:cell division suppressor protein YneA n=2 Tax=Brevibacillus TaxID=55080 RepID=UPI002857B676|nr:LysM peptidoglycan-binding domain-containing protein [Brevibacillus nitrificans]MDR7318723.1 nucleoid-associated protein YgaU [Brevibacillus nitrificans]MED1791755.1 LysM peptidoglycan-binding domain-containing protein [Brevibacillus nitrificans]
MMSVMTVHNRFAKKETRRARVGITRGQAIMFVVSFSLFFYLLTELVFASDANAVLPVKEVTVREGDSLWKLAIRYQEEAQMEVNELILAIQEVNELESVIIYPGQTLKIPVTSEQGL